MRRPDARDSSFTTLTHARLRALQGDDAAAARLLDELLEQEPDHAEARALLESLLGRGSIGSRPQAGTPRRSKAARIGRLEAWLRRVRRSG